MKIFTIICIVLISIISFQYFSDKESANPITSLPDSNPKTNIISNNTDNLTAYKKPQANNIASSQKREYKINKQEECISYDEYISSSEHINYISWMNELGYIPLQFVTANSHLEIHAHPYAYLDNESLQKMAYAQDNQAMLALGYNLIWQAIYQDDIHTDLVKENRNDELAPKINRSKLHEGRHWLLEAAINGLPYAIYGIEDSYRYETEWYQEKRLLTDRKLKMINRETSFAQALLNDIENNFKENIIKQDLINKENWDEQDIKIYEYLSDFYQISRKELGLGPMDIASQKSHLYSELDNKKICEF